jgi:hypothetical protein
MIKTIKSLPTFLDNMITSPPAAGLGVHRWLFKAARHLHAHYTAPEIITLLQKRVQDCGRLVPQGEIEEAVRNSIACAWQPANAAPLPSRTPKWPAVNQEQREAILRDYGGLAELWELGNPRPEDNTVETEQIIARLFPGNPLLCCGKSIYHFDTRPREEWGGKLAGQQFVVPSPMSAVQGLTKSSSKPSRHTLSNTGSRRFLVCEFDQGSLDEHAALLLHLGEIAPLVCVVHSGGKSLHGWFYVHAQPDDAANKFFRYAVSLGADDATWTRSQFVRMPDGCRNNGNRQTAYFLNFNPLNFTR